MGAYVEIKWNTLNNNVKENKGKLVNARNYLYKNYKSSGKKKISDSDLCDNELSDFEDDESRSVEKIVENNKTIPIWTRTITFRNGYRWKWYRKFWRRRKLWWKYWKSLMFKLVLMLKM